MPCADRVHMPLRTLARARICAWRQRTQRTLKNPPAILSVLFFFDSFSFRFSLYILCLTQRTRPAVRRESAPAFCFFVLVFLSLFRGWPTAAARRENKNLFFFGA
ncbi:hypothetical protein [Pandoravirus japonicus]|uniref:Transmembrane protein n=1 Tax=Pandoravirus japonicus TaxID=2823154 RepID=A0A811BNT8_9VIRU|nr:hypothetical protein [Pandoravirus japonicus]